MSVVVIPVLSDNYAYLLCAGNEAWVIDPSAAAPVLQALQTHGATLVGIAVTHHHHDHIGGVAALHAASGAPVSGPDDPRIPHLSDPVNDGDQRPFGATQIEVWSTPGHGQYDCSFLWHRPDEPLALFCGDALFVGGCGRILDGNAEALWHTLQRFKQLPDDTAVYCGHEYSAENWRFAATLAADNPAWTAQLDALQAAGAQTGCTVPSTIGQEKATNPFLRCTSLDQFVKGRQRKDQF